MRKTIIVLWVLFGSMTSAIAQVSIGIGLPGVSIGINLPVYPELVRVPNYPVYYAPGLNSNLFFYDGLYWVYQTDNWYSSSWYNGPWWLVAPEVVPLYVLRVPVSYYRNPPGYFRGWRSDGPPRWGEHWGNDWSRQRSGWDRWNRSSAPAPAPLPIYQRQYSGTRYPRVEQQQALQSRNYRYQPRDAVVRQRYQEQAVQTAPASARHEPQRAPQERTPRQQDTQRVVPPPPSQQGGPAAPRSMPPQREDVQRAAPPTRDRPQPSGPAQQEQRRQPPQGAAQPEPQMPRSGPKDAPQGKGAPQERGQERGQGQGQDKDRDKGEERGQGNKK